MIGHVCMISRGDPEHGGQQNFLRGRVARVGVGADRFNSEGPELVIDDGRDCFTPISVAPNEAGPTNSRARVRRFRHRCCHQGPRRRLGGRFPSIRWQSAADDQSHGPAARVRSTFARPLRCRDAVRTSRWFVWVDRGPEVNLDLVEWNGLPARKSGRLAAARGVHATRRWSESDSNSQSLLRGRR